MFKNFFKKYDEDDVFETVDPIVEKRRNEKFSKPLIYDDEFDEVKKEPEEKKQVQTKTTPKQKFVKPVEKTETKKSNVYEMMDIISPMFGKSDKEEKKVKKPTVTKPKKKSKYQSDSLVQVISPYYGNFEEKTDIESEALLTPTEDEPEVEIVEENKVVENKEEKLPTVEDNLRNIAKIVEEEKDQLKIIEERTGEFKLDFNDKKDNQDNSLIDEIDDNMSLDELMNLYEKKFKD